MEVWADIIGFEGKYQIGNLGSIRTIPHSIDYFHKKLGVFIKREHLGGLRKSFINTKGYPVVKLSKLGKMTSHAVHRLVAIHFVPNPDNLPEVNHLDNNRANPAHWNLEWTTHSGNMKHAVKTGQGAYGKPGWDVRARMKAKQNIVA